MGGQKKRKHRKQEGKKSGDGRYDETTGRKTDERIDLIIYFYCGLSFGQKKKKKMQVNSSHVLSHPLSCIHMLFFPVEQLSG